MNTPTNSEPPSFQVEVDGGQGVQIGAGNHQFNHYLIIQVDAAAASETAAAATGTHQPPEENTAWVIPRTRGQLHKVANDRPLAWGYLLFAGALIVEMEELDARYRDYLLGYAPRSAVPVYESNFMEFFQIQLNELINISTLFEQIFSTQVDEAVGPRGASSDPVTILHLAKRYISVYNELLHWTERLRGAPVPRKYQKLVGILSRYSEQPIAEIRRFVNYYAEQIERIPAALKAGTSVRLPVHVKFELPPELAQELSAERTRLKAPLTR